MEEIIPKLRNMLNEAIKIDIDEKNLEIHMLIKSKIKSSNDFANPYEVKTMLHMFGGLPQDYPLEVKINDDEQKIRLIFDSLDNLSVVQKTLESIWDKAVDLLEHCNAGNFSVIRNIGDIDE